MKPLKYLVIYERSATSFGAYVPDLPGCVAVGVTLSEVKKSIRKAIRMHLEAMRRDHIPIPRPSTQSEYLELAG